MFLKKLYSEPTGLFRSGKPEDQYIVFFKEGFNFIFAKKDQSNSKEPLNGTGKSTLADLIDFCLLADFSAKNKRLYKEKERLHGYKIVLEFEVSNINYIIKRTIDDSKNVEFGLLHQEKQIPIREAKAQLFHTIFKPFTNEVLEEKWYRSLMSFFLKIHKKKKGEFVDPINFLTQNNKMSEVNQYHFFLLGFNNKLICQNFQLQKDATDRNKAITQVKKIIEKDYKINIKEVEGQLSKLRNEIKKIKAGVEAFKLAEQFHNVETKLNQLTREIKLLSEESFWINKKIKSYRESCEVKDALSESKIKAVTYLYNEVNFYLGKIVNKSLQEAVEFRKNIASSREEFLKSEIINLEKTLKENEEKKNFLDEERGKLFTLLKSKNAFTDLTQAFYYLGEKEKEQLNLEGKIKIYRDLESQKQEYKIKDAQLGLEIKNFIEENQEQFDNFEKLFLEVYNHIYPESPSSGFSITPNFKADKININISFDKEESKGWNKGRSLIYDISVMLNAIRKNIHIPRFLLHDGIFDGMDKSQFVELYHYIKNLQEEGYKFQYIVTMMEEGMLKGNFGDTGDLTIDNITQEAIAVFTPNKKLWVTQ